MKHFYLALFLILYSSCTEEADFPKIPLITDEAIRDRINKDYVLLPEADFAKSLDGSVYALYAQPTEKYPHGVMGDKIEAEKLVVVVRGQFHELTLSEKYLFEDLRPRLYDVDLDGELEFITIRTHVDKGAGIAIYKVVSEELVEHAFISEVGISNRWLNPVAVHDIDDDGIVELIWVQTPHIGGILKIAKFHEGEMTVLDEAIQYSNHAGGARNLCLSVLTQNQDNKIFYVPNQTRDKIVGFSFSGTEFIQEETIEQTVDFLIPLEEQYPFENIIEDAVNCINI